MRGVIIDPWNQTVFATDLPRWGLAEMYEYLSGPDGFRKVDDINSVRLNRITILWVDGEGLLIPDVPIWNLNGYANPLAGKGLILGLNEEGDNIGTHIDTLFVKDMVKWTTQLTTGELGPSHTEGHVFHIGKPILKEKQ
jgi:hypothetical protein